LALELSGPTWTSVCERVAVPIGLGRQGCGLNIVASNPAEIMLLRMISPAGRRNDIAATSVLESSDS
jgi:hypothetical protein